MGVQIDGRVGPAAAADSTYNNLRLDKSGALGVTDAHGRYTEAVYRGNVFTAANQSGVATQAGLSATTPVLTLFNPAGSGKLGVLLYAGVGFPIAFAAAANVFLAANVNPLAAAVTGTAFTARNALLGGSAASVLQVFTAATLPAAPVAICLLGEALTGASTTVPYLLPLGRWFDGSIIIGQGCAISIQTSAASGASGALCEYAWEEIPV